jgi:hypothetical protein
MRNSARMDGRALLRALMERSQDNPNSLAVRLKRKPAQSTIQRYLVDANIEPTRKTLAPIAAHYGVPLDAFFNTKVAITVAKDRGFVVDSATINDAEVTEGAELAAPSYRQIPQRMPFERLNLSAAIRLLGSILEGVDDKSRKYISPILADLALTPDDAEELADRAVSQAKARPKQIVRNKKLQELLTDVENSPTTRPAPLNH